MVKPILVPMEHKGKPCYIGIDKYDVRIHLCGPRNGTIDGCNLLSISYSGIIRTPGIYNHVKLIGSYMYALDLDGHRKLKIESVDFE